MLEIKKFNRRYSGGRVSRDQTILSNKLRLETDCMQTDRNNNVLIIGAPGSGKTRGYVKPNILQANQNYVITDPKGEILKDTGKFLVDQGYEIKVFNISDMSRSNRYNPFIYCENETDVLRMIDCLIANTNPNGCRHSDPFWERSERLLLTAICLYLQDYCNAEDRNFTNAMKLLRLAEINENNPDKGSPLDTLFKEAENKDPNNLACKFYNGFKTAAGRTLKSIVISCIVRCQYFDIPEFGALTQADDLRLQELDMGKKALFIITPIEDTTFNFIVSMLYSQIISTHYKKYNRSEGLYCPGRKITLIMDEFCNIGYIPNIDLYMSTMRQYNISASIVIQSIAQLEAKYLQWETIIGNCDTIVFLGSNERRTAEYITYLFANTEKVRMGLLTNYSLFDNSKCIVKIRGEKSVVDKKFDYKKHCNYRYTGESSKENVFSFPTIIEIPEKSICRKIEKTEKLKEIEKELEENKNIPEECLYIDSSDFHRTDEEIIDELLPIGVEDLAELSGDIHLYKKKTKPSSGSSKADLIIEEDCLNEQE